jgi:phosphatidylglycerophosphatase A
VVALGPWACLALALVLTVAGFWAARTVLRDPNEDPGWFVADEGAGMLIALAALPAATLPGAALAFVLFRALDIAKPWPGLLGRCAAGHARRHAGRRAGRAIAGAVLLLIELLWPGMLV